MTDPQIIVDLKRDIERKQGELFTLKHRLSQLEDGVTIMCSDQVVENHYLERMGPDEAQDYLNHIKERTAKEIGLHMYREGVIKFDTLDGHSQISRTTIIRARAEVVK